MEITKILGMSAEKAEELEEKMKEAGELPNIEYFKPSQKDFEKMERCRIHGRESIRRNVDHERILGYYE